MRDDYSVSRGAHSPALRGWFQINASRFSPGDFPVLNASLQDRSGLFTRASTICHARAHVRRLGNTRHQHQASGTALLRPDADSLAVRRRTRSARPRTTMTFASRTAAAASRAGTFAAADSVRHVDTGSQRSNCRRRTLTAFAATPRQRRLTVRVVKFTQHDARPGVLQPSAHRSSSASSRSPTSAPPTVRQRFRPDCGGVQQQCSAWTLAARRENATRTKISSQRCAAAGVERRIERPDRAAHYDRPNVYVIAHRRASSAIHPSGYALHDPHRAHDSDGSSASHCASAPDGARGARSGSISAASSPTGMRTACRSGEEQLAGIPCARTFHTYHVTRRAVRVPQRSHRRAGSALDLNALRSISMRR